VAPRRFSKREPKEEGRRFKVVETKVGHEKASLPAVPAGRNCYLGKTPLVAVWKKVWIARSFRFGGEM
jgi:hypothetical protein